MAIPSYTPNYPPNGSTLGQTKSVIRNNLDGTFQTLGVDHINNNGQPGDFPAGYHNLIHMISQSGLPTTIGGLGQLYSKQVTSGGHSDEALFYLSGGGRLTQLTTNINGSGNTTLAAQNGYCTLTGGIILQWGQVAVSSTGDAAVNLPLAFPNSFFTLQATAQFASTVPSGGATIGYKINSNSQFQYYFNTNSDRYSYFTYIAIGN